MRILIHLQGLGILQLIYKIDKFQKSLKVLIQVEWIIYLLQSFPRSIQLIITIVDVGLVMKELKRDEKKDNN